MFRALVIVAIIGFSSLAFAEQSRFDEQGYRDPNGKTIVDWGQLAISARSEAFRGKAAFAVVRAAARHKESSDKFTEAELKDCRNGALLMLQGKDEVVRSRGCEAIGILKDKECIAPLLKLAESDNKSDSSSALTALADFADNSCLPVFLRIAARSDNNPSRAYFVIKCIARIGTDESKESLEKLKAKTKDANKIKVIDAALDEIEFK